LLRGQHAGADDDDGGGVRRGISAQFGDEVEAAAVRQAHVRQHEIDPTGLEHDPGGRQRRRLQQLEAVDGGCIAAADDGPDERTIGRLVLDEQDPEPVEPVNHAHRLHCRR
jgi:hypothetical protein